MVATSRVVRKVNVKVPDKMPAGPREVKVGFPAGSANVDKAIYNEFGTRGSGKGFKTSRGGGFGGPIPERPFMRNAMRNNQIKYVSILRSALKKYVESGFTGSLREILSKMGELAKRDIQDEITSLKSPPNSPVTIALKGSSNPLVDTGEMRQSVTYKVEG